MVVIGKKIIVYLSMKNFFLILFFTLISSAAFSQSKDSLCREFKKDTFYVKIASYMDLHKGDTLADIGAEYGYTIVRIAHYSPGVIFYEEDIKSRFTNRIMFKSTIKKACANVDLNSFRYFKGNSKNTKFPDHFFKKIFIGISVHEFEFKEEMMMDMKRILRNDGSLYIMECFFIKPELKEKNCIRPYMLEPEFDALMDQSGFKMVRKINLFEGVVESAENNYKTFFYEFKLK